MKLSIVICVYNTAIDYLAECIRSITESTLKEIGDDYEICMIDDGSTVDYSEILQKYRINYKKTENRGILSARTTGLAMACGEYIAFCDSDDSVSFHYYLPMVKKAEETNADIIINDWAFHTPRMRYYCKNDDLIKYDLDITGDQTLLSFVKNNGKQHSFYVLWNKLYRASLLRQSFDLLSASNYPKNSSYSEDAAINFFAWRDANRIVNVHTGYYFYRIHTTQSVNVASQKILYKQICTMSACLDMMRDNIGENVYREQILKHIQKWAELMSRSHYSYAVENKFTELYDLIRERYQTQKLSRSTIKDTDSYIGNILLGKNFTQIDSLLFSLWESPTVKKVSYCKRDRYTARCIDRLRREGKIEIVKSGQEDVLLPRADASTRLKLIHNGVIYTLG